MDVRTQDFLVVGAKKSGISVAEYVLKKGGKCGVFEERMTDVVKENLKKIKEMGGAVLDEKAAKEYLYHADVLVLSPGVPINCEFALMAKEMKKRITGEMEFGFINMLPLTVAVTGTNGKTTTVSLIEHVLKSVGKKSELIGNVGVPVTTKTDEITNDTVCVTEVSSFQLETAVFMFPHIACITNIAPDHLERHYSMENYVFLKKRLLSNLKESEYAVLNYDDERVKSFSDNAVFNTVYVSVYKKIEGAYYLDGWLYYKGEKIIAEEDLPISGKHNVYDVLFAIATLKILGLKNEDIEAGLKTFKGVPHRNEFVIEKGGVIYINDSKATNTASTISAIEELNRPAVLILGGSEKGENYDLLFEKIKSGLIKHTVITGASRYNMLSSATKVGYSKVTVTDDFITAIKIASLFSEEGDEVLLSPACASFDKFSGYEERGNLFKQEVQKL